MEIAAGATKASGRATDELEAIIRRLRASAARPPPPLRCALARTPNNPCYREALEAVCAARPGILTAIRNSPLQALAQGRQNPGGTEPCREKDPGRQSSMILSLPVAALPCCALCGYDLLLMGSRTRERVAAGVSTISAALGFQGRAAVGVSPCQTLRARDRGRPDKLPRAHSPPRQPLHFASRCSTRMACGTVRRASRLPSHVKTQTHPLSTSAQLSPDRLRGGLAAFSSAPFASLCQTPQTSPTVAN